MPCFSCITCGAQFPESAAPPDACPICQDERQYVNPGGQQWITPEALRAGHHNDFKDIEPNLTGIRTSPEFAISQRALLVQTPEGNVLWDCISLIDDATVDAVNKRGGLSAIALSHPHLYGSMVDWSRAFGGIPIYAHAEDARWVMRPDPAIHFWKGDSLALNSRVTLVHCGGHFEGSSVLHWKDGAVGNGVLLTGDTAMIVSDARYVTFQYSFPNRLPLPVRKVRGIVNALQPYAFDRLYDAFEGKVIASRAKAAVQASADRYIRLILDE